MFSSCSSNEANRFVARNETMGKQKFKGSPLVHCVCANPGRVHWLRARIILFCNKKCKIIPYISQVWFSSLIFIFIHSCFYLIFKQNVNFWAFILFIPFSFYSAHILFHQHIIFDGCLVQFWALKRIKKLLNTSNLWAIFEVFLFFCPIYFRLTGGKARDPMGKKAVKLPRRLSE